MANGKKTDQGRIDAAERRQQALELRKAGESYRAIGQQLNISEKTAHQDVQRALARLAEMELSSADELRTMELARLDKLTVEAARVLAAPHPLVSGGKVLDGLTDDGPKLAAIDRLIRISESRRRLLGLDRQQPITIEQTYVLSEHERLERIIGLLDAARARAIGQPVIDVTPEPGDVAPGDDAE
jgi:Sigma-70, region 4